MKPTAQGLTILRDERGVPYAQLEFATGRLLTLSGAFTGTTLERHGPSDRDDYPEDGDCLLSDFAARLAYSGIAKATGKPVTMRDANGQSVQVNMDLAQSDVHIAAAIPNYAAGYSLADGVADLVMPILPVAKDNNKFFTWDSANAFKRVLPTATSAGGGVPEVNPTLSNDKYQTVEYALAAFMPTEVEANADAPLVPGQAAMTRLWNALKLEREIRVATAITTSTNWDSNNVIALAAGAQWNGGASSDPVANLQSLKEKSFAKLTALVFGEPAYHAFVRNAQVRGYWAFKAGDDTTLPSPDKISALLRLPPIIVADMKYSVAGAPTYAWPSAAGASSSVVALHQPPQIPPTSQQDVATALTFRWTGATAPDGTVTAGFMVRSFYDPKRGARGGRQFVLAHNDAEQMTSKIVGGLLTGVIQ